MKKTIELITFIFFIISCNSAIEVESLSDDLSTDNSTEESINTVSAVFGKLVAGGEHVCYLADSKNVFCWGKNTSGQLGVGHENAIGNDETFDTFASAGLGFSVNSKLYAGSYHSCVLDSSQNLKCWGEAGNGRSGHMTHANGLGDNIDVGDNEQPSVFASSDFGVDVKVAAPAGLNSCVLLTDDNVRCWGSGSSGSLGNASTVNQRYYEDATNMNLNLNGGERVVDIKGGGLHYCVLTNLGNIKCWGDNSNGMLGYAHTDQIGNDETTSGLLNVSLGSSKATQIELSNTITCAIFENGKAKCWGRNSEGQLGLGHINNIGDDETPENIAYIEFDRKIIQIAPGNHHTCALLESGEVRCWGSGGSGQRGDANGATALIGDDEGLDQTEVVDIGGLAIAITSYYHGTCALREDKAIFCWGVGTDGKLGAGRTDNIGDDEYPVSSDPISFN